MKKLLCFLCAFVMLAGTVGCGNGPVSKPIENATTEIGLVSNNEEKSLEKKQLEIVESGYGIVGGYNTSYLYYGFILRNPNSDFGVSFPTVRITARSADGRILGTEDKVLNEIYPNQTIADGFQAFSVSENPAAVDFEVLEPDEYNWINAESLEMKDFQALSVENIFVADDYFGKKYTGEVINSNPYNIDSVSITIIFRDQTGKIVGGDTTYCDKLSANGKIPFDIKPPKDILTDNFEVYAKTW